MSTQVKEWYAGGLRFTCTQCGNCCSGPPGYVWYDAAEEQAMADHLKLSIANFRQRYAIRHEGGWSLCEKLTPQGYDCIFLKRNGDGKGLCSIYEVRPKQCRTWPFWPDNLKSPRAWVNAGSRCPGMTAGNGGQGKLYAVEQIRIIRDEQKQMPGGK
ncbi:MAG: YkgJ family cysteine cluster protein [Phycisphaeraceae bacterium]